MFCVIVGSWEAWDNLRVQMPKYLRQTVLSILDLYSFRLSFVGVVALSFVISQALLFSAILSFIGGNFSSYTIPFSEITIYFENKFLLVIMMGVFGLISIILVYISKIVSVGIMIDYERYCVSLLSQKLVESSSSQWALSKKEYVGMCTKDCRFGGRLAYEISNSIMPVGVCTILIPILFVLNTVLTSLIFLVVILTIISQAFLKPKIARTAHLMETLARDDANAKLIEYDKIVAANDRSASNINYDFSRRIPDPGFLEVYKTRLILPHLGNFIGSASFLAILIVIIVFYSLESSIFTQNESYLYYCMIAFFCFSQMRTLSKIYVNISVFNEYFSRARQFIETGEYASSQRKTYLKEDSPINDENEFYE